MSKKAKRRSLLPQFNRKVSNEDKQEHGGIKEEDEEDGGDGYRPAPRDLQDSGGNAGGRIVDADRQSVIMPPPSKLTRPMSTIPPRGSSQVGKTTQTRSHARDDSGEKESDAEVARAQSLAALTGGAATIPSNLGNADSGLKRTGSTRMPQPSPRPAIPSRTTSKLQDGQTRPSSKARDEHSRTASKVLDSRTRTTSVTNGNATPSTVAEKRASVTRPRPPSIIASTVSQAPRQTSPTSPQRSSMMSRPRPMSQMPPPSQKPAFNTFQQHYSPAKSALPRAPVPPSKSSKPAPTSTEEDTPMTFDIAKQQIELLQLSLLHQASVKSTHDYTTSAKRKLNRKHTKLRKDYENIRATELVHQRAASLAALESWCSDPGLLVENLQILSMVYSDLSALMEEGSRHGHIVQMFELWINDAEAPASGGFVQPLPEEWRSAHASLALKLRAIQRNLGVLPPLPENNNVERSGLQVVLEGCKKLVDGMVKELEVMTRLEGEVMARETARVEDEVKSLMMDDGGRYAWTPAWQKMA